MKAKVKNTGEEITVRQMNGSEWFTDERGETYHCADLLFLSAVDDQERGDKREKAEETFFWTRQLCEFTRALIAADDDPKGHVQEITKAAGEYLTEIIKYIRT